LDLVGGGGETINIGWVYQDVNGDMEKKTVIYEPPKELLPNGEFVPVETFEDRDWYDFLMREQRRIYNEKLINMNSQRQQLQANLKENDQIHIFNDFIVDQQQHQQRLTINNNSRTSNFNKS